MDMTGTFVDTCVQVREVIHNTDKIVVLYFFTEWSPKCRHIRFDFMFAKQQNTDMIYIAANMDRARGIAKKYHVTLDDIPALVVFKDGSIVFAATHITANHFYRSDYNNSICGETNDLSDAPQTTTTYLRELREDGNEEQTDTSISMTTDSAPAPAQKKDSNTDSTRDNDNNDLITNSQQQ